MDTGGVTAAHETAATCCSSVVLPITVGGGLDSVSANVFFFSFYMNHSAFH
jgi:hypothetical protein